MKNSKSINIVLLGIDKENKLLYMVELNVKEQKLKLKSVPGCQNVQERTTNICLNEFNVCEYSMYS